MTSLLSTPSDGDDYRSYHQDVISDRDLLEYLEAETEIAEAALDADGVSRRYYRITSGQNGGQLMGEDAVTEFRIRAAINRRFIQYLQGDPGDGAESTTPAIVEIIERALGREPEPMMDQGAKALLNELFGLDHG